MEPSFFLIRLFKTPFLSKKLSLFERSMPWNYRLFSNAYTAEYQQLNAQNLLVVGFDRVNKVYIPILGPYFRTSYDIA